jgi:hypothetical protein
VAVWLHTFLTSALDGGDWSASRPGRYMPVEALPVRVVYEGGWASGPVWTRGRRERKSLPCSYAEWNPGRPTHIVSLYIDWAIPALKSVGEMEEGFQIPVGRWLSGSPMGSAGPFPGGQVTGAWSWQSAANGNIDYNVTSTTFIRLRIKTTEQRVTDETNWLTH